MLYIERYIRGDTCDAYLGMCLYLNALVLYKHTHLGLRMYTRELGMSSELHKNKV